MSNFLPLRLLIPDGVDTTIQSCINAAAKGPRSAVWIPSNYTGTDTYSNPQNVPVFDMRYPGSINFTGNTTNAALKPTAADAIQYVAADGNDSADGLSWGSAKKTIMAAYDALPSSGGTIMILGPGVANTTWPSATSTPGQGIWIMGPGDPNYASPPPGWRKAKDGGNVRVTFIGVPSSNRGGSSSSGNLAAFLGGSSTAPAIWLSNCSGVTFRNLATQYPKSFAWLGINSNGIKNNAAGGSDIVFESCSANCSGDSTYGPVVNIGPNLFWVRFSNCSFWCNPNADATSDNRCGILIDEQISNGASAILIFENVTFTGGGGIRYYNNHQGTASHTIRDISAEGQANSQPLYEVINAAGTMFANIWLGDGIADSGDRPPLVRTPPTMWNDRVTVYLHGNTGSISLDGPMTVFGPFPQQEIKNNTVYGRGVAVTTPTAKNQSGIARGLLIAGTNAGRRLFAPTVARFLNRASQLPSAWIPRTTVIITPGQLAPDGTLNAAKIASADSSPNWAYCASVNETVLAGDYIYAGVWAKFASPQRITNGLDDHGFVITGGDRFRILSSSQNARLTGSTSGNIAVPLYYASDGDWQWIWVLAKMTVTEINAPLQMELHVNDNQHPIYFYAPVFVHLPLSQITTQSALTVDTVANSGATQSGNIVTITTTAPHNLMLGQTVVISGVTNSGYDGEYVVLSAPTSTTFTYYTDTTGLSTSGGGTVYVSNDSEAAEWALQVAPYPDGLTAPTVATLRGAPLAFGGSGDNFHTILDHTALTQNRTVTFPDNTGTIAELNYAQSWTALQTFQNNLKIGASGTAITRANKFVITFTAAAVGPNTTSDQTLSASGVTTSDVVFLNAPALGTGIGIGNVRPIANNIVVTYMNNTAGTVTPNAGVYNAWVIGS